ncbi:MAG: hypothetical protein AAGB29_12560 [Planctomycetota bacterium]
MAKAPVIKALSPWEDRWNVPELDTLLNSLGAEKKESFTKMLADFDAFPGTRQTLVWHGESWKWALQFDLTHPETGAELGTMAYLVFFPETPTVCVPLSNEMVAAFPIRRLNRFVREAIRGAKCAVDVHWCLFTPSAGFEFEHLNDLYKRKHKFLLNPPETIAGYEPE